MTAPSLAELDEMDIRIPFGPRPNQTMPASWAAAMLTAWHAANPNTFGKALAKAAV